MTLNLLHQSSIALEISASAHMCGPFDYNKIPLAPWAANSKFMKQLTKGVTWAYHLINGWYLYTLPEHYCTHTRHIKATLNKRLSNTIKFYSNTPEVAPHTAN